MQLPLELPDQARVWVFSLANALDQDSESALNQALKDVISNWKAHGSKVQGGCGIAYHRFLIAAADEEITNVSGCSIDSLVKGVKDAAKKVGAELADESHVFYRDTNRNIIQVERDTFRTLVSNGVITPSTTVFNNTVQTLSDIRNGRWECFARDSWHARAFRFPASTDQSVLG